MGKLGSVEQLLLQLRCFDEVMGMREKLIELICVPIKVMPDKEDMSPTIRFKMPYAEEVADFLIANGVTIPVRCKDCQHHEHYDALLYCGHIRGLAGSVAPDDFCSYGERRTDVD